MSEITTLGQRIDELMPVLDRIFKFEIGQPVKPTFWRPIETRRDTKLSRRHRIMRDSDAIVLQVVERTLQQCHGGIQMQYLCRLAFETGVSSEYQRLAEPELRALTEHELALVTTPPSATANGDDDID